MVKTVYRKPRYCNDSSHNNDDYKRKVTNFLFILKFILATYYILFILVSKRFFAT